MALEVAASNILRSAAPGNIKRPFAMRLAGFTDDESKISKLQMRVRRLLFRPTVPSDIDLNSGTGTVLTMSKSRDDKESSDTAVTPKTPPPKSKKHRPPRVKPPPSQSKQQHHQLPNKRKLGHCQVSRFRYKKSHRRRSSVVDNGWCNWKGKHQLQNQQEGHQIRKRHMMPG
jgi:hypothetical protein